MIINPMKFKLIVLYKVGKLKELRISLGYNTLKLRNTYKMPLEI